MYIYIYIHIYIYMYTYIHMYTFEISEDRLESPRYTSPHPDILPSLPACVPNQLVPLSPLSGRPCPLNHRTCLFH